MVWVERTVETVEQDKQPQTGDARARPPARPPAERGFGYH